MSEQTPSQTPDHTPSLAPAVPALPPVSHGPAETSSAHNAASLDDYPLALASTPHFLQRFIYNNEGNCHVFDESQLGTSLWEQRNKRLNRLGAHIDGGLISKRRPVDLFLPPRKRHADEISDAESDTAVAAPPAPPVPQSPRDDQFSLLSPTVSPREPSDSASLLGGDHMDTVSEPNELTELSSGSANVPFASNNSLGAATTHGGFVVPSSTSIPGSENDLATKIPALVDAFEQLPQDTHRYALFSMFRSCNRQTLSAMVSLMNDALRNDVLSRLPPELADICLSYLDAKSLCSVSQVCRHWYNLVENNEPIWKDLLDQDLLYLTQGDIDRAKHEGWGYTGWTQEGAPSRKAPVNMKGKPVNIYKAIYRRKHLISRNWMSPNSMPRHFSIPCASQGVITCLEFDEDRIIAGSDGKYINIYDTHTGELLNHFSDHDGGVWALKYVNKDILVSGSTDRTIRVWSISKAKCTHLFRGHSSTVRCLDIVMPVKKVDPDSGKITYVPESPLIVTGSRDATLRMWRLPGPDEPEFHSRSVDDVDPYFVRSFQGHTNPVRAINGYEDTVVSGSYDTTVRVWKISTGECLWELTGHQQKVYSAVIDAKRNRCISASMDWSVKVWCIETGTLLYTLEGHTSLVGLLDLNRTTLVSAAADSTLRVWDPESGMLLHKLVGHQGPISCFQHDENKVISGSEQTLKLWNIRTGELVGDLFEGLDLASIWQVGFDSRRCVSAVARNDGSYLEVLDFDYDPNNPGDLHDTADPDGQWHSADSQDEENALVRRQPKIGGRRFRPEWADSTVDVTGQHSRMLLGNNSDVGSVPSVRFTELTEGDRPMFNRMDGQATDAQQTTGPVISHTDSDPMRLFGRPSEEPPSRGA